MSTGEKMTEKDTGEEALARERYELLQRLEDWLDVPMVVLAFVWLALLAVELIWGETPASEILFAFIWIIFILNFILEFILAPQKIAYLKSNWLTAIAVLVPGLRIFRAFRAVRVLGLAKAGRSLNLFRLVSSLNRGMKALAASLSRRGFGYVLMLTAMVVITGAAGMYAFENVPGGLNSYGEALWWTAMIMMTTGSQVLAADDGGAGAVFYPGPVCVRGLRVRDGGVCKFFYRAGRGKRRSRGGRGQANHRSPGGGERVAGRDPDIGAAAAGPGEPSPNPL